MSTSSPDHPYRTQRCDALRLTQVDEKVRLAGWIARKRDHGNLLFVDLRDHWGVTQCVMERPEIGEGGEGGEEGKGGEDGEGGEDGDGGGGGDALSPLQQRQAQLFAELEAMPLESVVSMAGCVRARSSDTVNPRMPTGEAELALETMTLLSRAAPLPMPVNRDADYPEDLRLQYRFLDLRRESMRRKILLRAQVIASLRRRMTAEDFVEFQTPILTASSPEGARDFLVPSRLHPQQFYALPQAPQQFKQLLMIAGFERYFQIAPCFRDEDARADRSPGEFYQLDFEMAFATQDEIMQTIERVLAGLFEEFADGAHVSPTPFPRLTYEEALLRYGSDKPDLRNPIEIVEVGDLFADSNFALFAKAVAEGGCVRALRAPGAALQPRSFFDKLNLWAREQGQGGLGYIVYPTLDNPQGPIARNISKDLAQDLRQRAEGLADGDALFFVCAEKKAAALFAGKVRERLADLCACREENRFAFCWIVDFPLYERDPETQKIVFSHNPFSLPKGGLEALENLDPLSITACQYDIVCNGIELSSGALRNFELATLERAFAIAGYGKQELEARFAGMLSALRFGVPPHGGAAPGIERMVMLLARESNIREVTCFPLNQTGQDSMMGAPGSISPQQLKGLGLKLA